MEAYKKPCPRFITGFSEAAAASLTMDHTSFLWLATRVAGLTVWAMVLRSCMDFLGVTTIRGE